MSLILREIRHIFPETNHMFLNNRDVQRQEGSNDCGLFALAYMYTLCSGNNPSLCAYTQSKMRDHYNNCITNKYFDAFPQTSLKRKHINDKNMNMMSKKTNGNRNFCKNIIINITNEYLNSIIY